VNNWQSAICFTTCLVLLAVGPTELSAQRKHGEGVPIIMQQPESQTGTNGIATLFKAAAETEPPFETDQVRYTWQFNGAGTPFDNGRDWKDIDTSDTQFSGADTNVLTIKSAGTSNVGWYRVHITGKNEAKAIDSEPASLCLYSKILKKNSKDPIVLYGPPVVTGPMSSGACPGQYVGYVNFKKALPAWGWVPTSSTNAHTATDGARTDTKVEMSGSSGTDRPCGTNVQTAPVLTGNLNPKYRFTIYFPNNPPTGPYSIALGGFDP
jgi:hypothetical protein